VEETVTWDRGFRERKARPLPLAAHLSSSDGQDSNQSGNATEALQKATQNPLGSLISVPLQNNTNTEEQEKALLEKRLKELEQESPQKQYGFTIANRNKRKVPTSRTSG
jgi:hypothetical protein